MLDRTISFYNTILKCQNYETKEIILPKKFSIVSYKKGYEKAWAELEYSIGDFGSYNEAENYFVENYLHNKELWDNILFLLNSDDGVIGSCIAWQDKRKVLDVSSLHWLIVDEKYQGMGLGKALCYAAMNIFEEHKKLPVYIHTQPWSWKAIFLYISVGFRLQKTDTFAQYENEYHNAMRELKKVVTKEQFKLLQEMSE